MLFLENEVLNEEISISSFRFIFSRELRIYTSWILQSWVRFSRLNEPIATSAVKSLTSERRNMGSRRDVC